MKRGALAFSKQRDRLGLVCIEVRNQQAHVRLIREWTSVDFSKATGEIADLYGGIEWGATYIDQEYNEHIIQEFKRAYKLPVKIITTQKKLKEGKKIDRVRVMDRVEQTEYLRRLIKDRQIQLPKDDSPRVHEMIRQMEFFQKHVSEAGSIDYFGPGEQADDLVRGLMLACFSCRHVLDGHSSPGYIGAIYPGLQKDYTFDDAVNATFGLSDISGQVM